MSKKLIEVSKATILAQSAIIKGFMEGLASTADNSQEAAEWLSRLRENEELSGETVGFLDKELASYADPATPDGVDGGDGIDGCIDAGGDLPCGLPPDEVLVLDGDLPAADPVPDESVVVS